MGTAKIVFYYLGQCVKWVFIIIWKIAYYTGLGIFKYIRWMMGGNK